ncbi:hypothetical protein BJY00DRAFT_61260 [Aspergillus carlsbadensis]|nr:hypothetical protein BJY00DRAFT_61260 [Aspergillus carlsbadensis]
MADTNRSLSACLRCRRKKLKCGGPSQIPCQRCRTSRAECVFVPPKPIRGPSGMADVGESTSDKLTLLERRIDAMEARHRAEMQDMQSAISRLASGSPSVLRSNTSIDASQPTPLPSAPCGGEDIVARGLVTATEWEELYDFFRENCRTVIGFVDIEMYFSHQIARKHPFMATVICVLASRAIRPEKYQTYLDAADELIKDTFAGPTPDCHFVRALMLLNAWTGRTRLWGYVASISAELGLNTAALQLGDTAIEITSDLVQRARTWFTLCCFDLMLNLNRPFVINKMREYLPFAKVLLTSPFCQPVDHRICAYIVGFTITADAKAQLPRSQLHSSPLGQEEIRLLTSFNQRIDGWFHKINTTIEPEYQTFTDRQDRNRFLIPYAFMKIFINGFALHGIGSDNGVQDPSRLAFVQTALDNACLLIRTQFESDNFRRRFRYTIDYNGTTTYQAINFILKAIQAAYQYIQCGEALTALRKAAQMFEEAGAPEAAKEVRQEQRKMAVLTQTILSPIEDDNLRPGPATIDDETFFDIPNFLDAATWDEPFPIIDMYMLD